jgi:two-component system OmpR family response regulator
MRALVVEDDTGMASVLVRGMQEAGFAVDHAETGRDGLWLGIEVEYDVAVVDLGLPDMDGISVLTQLRSAERWLPVLVLTARDGVPHRVSGLDAGADDYLVKPFAFDELLARLRALVRRGPRARPAVLVVDDLTLDPATRTVRRGEVLIALTSKEFGLLECLMRAPGQVLSRSYLIEHVWDLGFDCDSNVVDVYVGQLRAKIDRPFARHSLGTVRGAGYVLRGDDDRR